MEKIRMTEKLAGKRIREKRRQLGITMKGSPAEQLGRVPTYYADIRRGKLPDVGGNDDRNFRTVPICPWIT